MVSDTDSMDEDTQIEATQHQPTVMDMKSYYTADYSKRGNNNPHHNTISLRKGKPKKNPKKKTKKKK